MMATYTNFSIIKKIYNKVEKNRIIAFILVMMITSIILFRDFIFGNYLLLYTDANDDTFQSFLPIYQMVVNRLLNGKFDCMDFSSGLGENIISLQLAIFDPFAIINYIVGLVCGIDKIAYALVYTQICRIVVAGLACKYALSFSKISIFSQYLCSFMYAFSAYTVGDIGQHYFFATALVFIALGYGLIMHCKENNKITVLLSIYVAIVCIWSVYFAFMILGACAVFFIFNIMNSHRINKIYCLNIIFAVIIGIMISAIIFIPSASLILCMTDRVNNGISFTEKIKGLFHFFEIDEYKDIFLRMFSNQLGGALTSWKGVDTSFNTEHLYYSNIFPIAFIYYIYHVLKEKNRKKKIITFMFIITIFICVITPIAGTIMNAFSEYSSRYLFVLFPFMAYVVGLFLDGIKDKKIENKYIIMLLVGVITFSIYCIFSKYNYESLAARKSITIVVISYLLYIGLMLVYDKIFTKSGIMLVLGIILSIVNLFDGSVSLQVERNIVCKDFYRDNGVNYSVKNAVEQTNASGNKFWRVERSFLDYGIQTATMYSNVANYRGVSFYNSLSSPELNEFRYKMLGVKTYSQTRATYAFGDFGLPFDNVIADFMGIKYIISDYIVDDNKWNYIDEVAGRHLYKNVGLENAGLLYDSYITQNNVEELSEIEQEQLLSNTVVVEHNLTGFKNYVPNKSDEYQMDLLNVEQIITSNQSFELPIENRLEGRNWIEIQLNCTESGNIQLLYDTTFGYYQGFWENQLCSYGEGGNNLLVRVPNDVSKICLIPSSDISVQRIKLISVTEKNYSNEGVNLINNKMGGGISGTITTSTPKIFVLPVLYNNNWKAKIDNKDVNIIKVNYCFIGMIVPEGNHSITLEYCCPGIKVGILISIIGLLLLSIYIFLLLKKYIKIYKCLDDIKIPV